jgi:hypothetical protein
MAETKIIVDFVRTDGIAFSSASSPIDIGAPTTTLTEEARRVRLGMTDVLLPSTQPDFGVFRRMLNLVDQIKRPVYAKVTDGVIEDLRVPVVGRVLSLQREADGTRVVQMEGSAARHVLRPDNFAYAAIDEELARAEEDSDRRMLTSTVGRQEIIDVRPLAAPPHIPVLVVKNFSITPLVDAAALEEISVVSKAEADNIFLAFAGQTCALPKGADGCIPFLFPKDGCWARAERMCDLLAGQGIRAGKIWAHGDLFVTTRNNENCLVSWKWHVAPVLHVDNGKSVDLAVFDPALFMTHVGQHDWEMALGGVNVNISITDASVFRQELRGMFTSEPPGQMASDLKAYLAELERLAKGGSAPPPFGNCAQ